MGSKLCAFPLNQDGYPGGLPIVQNTKSVCSFAIKKQERKYQKNAMEKNMNKLSPALTKISYVLSGSETSASAVAIGSCLSKLMQDRLVVFCGLNLIQLMCLPIYLFGLSLAHCLVTQGSLYPPGDEHGSKNNPL